MNHYTEPSQTIGFFNYRQQWIWSRELPIRLCKLATYCLFLTLFFLPFNSLWFNITISTVFGSTYYVLSETQPQLMMIVSMLINYQIRKIKNKINKIFSFIFSSTTELNNKNMLQTEDNFNFLEYYDNTGKKDKKYIFLFNKKFRSNDLIIFKDEFDKDITDSIEPYLGPMQNFHGVPLTPADFNHKKIKVFRDGEICISKVFDENEPLVIC